VDRSFEPRVHATPTPASSHAPHAQNQPVATTVKSVEQGVMKESQGDGEGASVAAG